MNTLKTIKIIFSILFVCSSIQSQESDSVKYIEAYNTINSSDTAKDMFKDYFKSCNNLKLCISKQIVKPDILPFIKDIIDYEFPQASQFSRDSLENSLRQKYINDYDIVLDSNSKIKNYFSSKESCDLIIFFSPIEDDKVFVSIELFTAKIDDYMYIIKSLSPVSVIGLCYFEGNSISKIFLKRIFQ